MYTIEGDLGLMVRMKELFSTDQGIPEREPGGEVSGKGRPGGPLPLSGMAWLTAAFVPWMVNWVTAGLPAGVLPLRAVFGLPLLLAALLWGYRRIFDRPTLMETGTLAYFLVAFLTTLGGNGFFTAFGDVLSFLALALLWADSLGTAMPVTGEYSKWDWPPSLWTTSVFIKTNAVITVAWVGIYLLQAVATLAGRYMSAESIMWTIVCYSLLIPGFVFTACYQKWYPTYGYVKEKGL
ncbi:MAG TPA: hypothetical protein VMW83_16045 [Spirochaetia bacterium]|nr:hypothetical protein [Spirochaetia bacterium]